MGICGGKPAYVDKTVVIIGGGVAGVNVAKQLDGSCNVILVDPKDSFILPYAIHRNICEGSSEVIMSYSKIFNYRGTFIKGLLTGVNSAENKVTIQTESSSLDLTYDELVICTGTNLCKFAKNKGDEIFSFFKEMKQRVSNASTIAVVGAGAVGVEFVGDLKYFYPEKKITLVGKKILPNPRGASDDFRKNLEDLLKKQNIERNMNHVLNALKPETWEDRCVDKFTLQFEDNSSAEYELVIFSTGISKPNSFNLDGKPVEAFLDVGKNMQLKGHNNIWSLGDCSNISNNKFGYLGADQGDCLGKGLVGKLHSNAVVPEWKGDKDNNILVPVGKKEGMAYLGGTTLGPCLTQMIKGDCFVGMQRGAMNLNKTDLVWKYDYSQSPSVDRFLTKHNISNADDVKSAVLVCVGY